MSKDEYLYWKEYFLSQKGIKNLSHLKQKLKNKRIVCYSNGDLFDAMVDTEKFSENINITAVSDIRYNSNPMDNYKGFKCIKPDELKNLEYDAILVPSANPKSIKKYLRNTLGINKKIIPVLEESNGLISKLKAFSEFLNVTKDVKKSIKYLIFCSEKEFKTKINYEKVLKKIKAKEKIRALFVCEENTKWGYNSLYKALKNDERYEVLPVVLYPVITKSRVEFTQKENAEFFAKAGVEAIDGYDYENNINIDLKKYEPDIVFYQQPWYVSGKNHPYEVSEYALTMMIPYGFTTLNKKDWGSDSVKKVYSSLWKFFSETKYHNRFYSSAAKMRGKDILLSTGTPKLDAYSEKIAVSDGDIWKGETGNFRIIWAPHHSINGEGLAMSTFAQNYKYFLDFAKYHKGYSFILKPHPALKNMCIKTGFMSEKEYDDYINEWNSLPNAKVYNEGNYYDIFKTSDILITDCSSFLAEYLPSVHPIIFLDRKGRAPFDSFGNKIKKGFYYALTKQDFEKVLKTVLADRNDYLKNKREIIISKYFKNTKTPASDKIKAFLDSELK